MSPEFYPAIINGEKVATGKSLDDINPSTGKVFAQFARCGLDEIDQAVEAAREASNRVWRETDAAARGAVVRRMGELLLQNKTELTHLESLDTGKPLTQANADVMVSSRYFTYYASAIETLHGDNIQGKKDAFAYTEREPFGVTAHIIPWNYPMQISARTLAPALVAGNCCILKPAEEAPLTSIRLCELALEAGLPAGVLNVVPGLGHEAGAALSAHPGIDHLSFTGSRQVGTLVARAAAENIVPVTLELGGKSPNIVFPDADLDVAIPTIVNSIIQNAGQTCSAGSRLLVHESINEEVLERIVKALSDIRIGHGADDPDLGPVISEQQLERVVSYVRQARNDSNLVCGGGLPVDEKLAGGFFFLPTLFANVKSGMPIWREEVFGPVLAGATFKDDEEALALANDSEYGMISAIWTSNVQRAHRMAKELLCAQVYVNSYGAGGGVELPFGGYKRSGYGREKGFEGLLQYTQLKTVLFKL